MYDERKERFTIKDLLIQVLFVGVFIFLLVWLFPLKSDVNKRFDKLNNNLNNSLSPLYDQIFNQNVMAMKEAAITYYTTSRLPQKVGQEEKMTLSKMLEENLVLPFVDKDGKQCDLMESYVSITKMDEEYILKINLKCGNQEDYLLVHLGCYNYCDGNVCEKEEEKPQQPVTPSKPDTPSKPVVNDTYLYEYVKVTDGKWGEYGDWSDWIENVITSTDYRQVETKTEKVVTDVDKTITVYEPIWGTQEVPNGTVTKYRDVSTIVGYKPIYETQKVPYDKEVTTYEKSCTNETQYKIVYEDGDKCLQYDKKIVGVKNNQELDCTDGCKVVSKPTYTYETDYSNCLKYEQVANKVPNGTKEVCTTGPKTDIVTDYKYAPVKVGSEPIWVTKKESYEEIVYKTIKVQIGTKPVTTTVKEPVETTVTYYRSRTREYISGSIDTKWSKSQNDTSLLEADYTLTGNSKKQ